MAARPSKKAGVKRKRNAPSAAALAEEAELERQLFGDAGAVEAAFGKTGDDEEERPRKKRKTQAKEEELAPAWQDEDDDKIRMNLVDGNRTKKLRKTEGETVISGRDYEDRLRQQYTLISGPAAWADLSARKPEQDDEITDIPLTRRAGAVIGVSSKQLLPGILKISRVNNANIEEAPDVTLQSVRFHPNGQMLFTAGLDKKLRLFQVDGDRNTRIQTVMIPELPIISAEFTADGKQIVVAGRRKFFYTYDLESGRVEKSHSIMGRAEKSLERFIMDPSGKYIAFFGDDGTIILVSQANKTWAANLKMNGSLRAAAFSADGSRLYTAGGDAEVYVWDMASRRCIHRMTDDGALHTTALAVSPDGQYLAVGADSGVVNVYELPAAMTTAAPKPLRALLQLTTAADQLRFNHDAQLLAISSKDKRDAMRLIHLPSCTAFSNWPNQKTPLHYVSNVAFSPSSGFIVVGNARGKALMWRLNHYPSV